MVVSTQVGTVEEVVLLSAGGEAVGRVPKADVHHGATPLHLAFSCHVVDTDGRVLVTRRAASKVAWPLIWTNAVCGHPAPGESLEDAVRRRALDELGLVVPGVRLVLPRFAYAAVSAGVLEHELCPVVVAVVPRGSSLTPAPAEVADHRWLAWAELSASIEADPAAWSPWMRLQLGLLEGPPTQWPTAVDDTLPQALRPIG